jgi:hypothetical protein
MSYQEFFIEFLSTESVIKKKYKDVLVKELRSITRVIIINPLTKEE